MPKENPHRSGLRDRPKHSKKGGGVARMTVKKGGAGARAWGKPGDEMRYQDDPHYLNENDPNFDPIDASSFKPSLEQQARFVSSAADLKHYKTTIKTAINEYLVSEDFKEFARVVVDLDMTVYHQELTKIIVTKSMDKKPLERLKLSALLAYLHTEGHLTASQSKAGFTKMYNRLDELLVDAPNALSILNEFTEHAVSNGFLNTADVDEFAAQAKLSSETEVISTFKSQIKTLVSEYIISEDIADFSQSLSELNQPLLGYEVVKRLIYVALDGKDRTKEVVSLFLGQVEDAVLSKDQIAKGFSVLLTRTEDMYLDTPQILTLMSGFICRAIVDEALPPSFIVRQDLEDDDMGYQVVEHAQSMMKMRGVAAMLSEIWVPQEEEEEEEKKEA